MPLDDSRTSAGVSLEVFWVRLQELEERHRQARRAHETARRRLEAVRDSRDGRDGDLHLCWESYCEAIASLDDATSELEMFRGGAIRAFSD